MFLFHSFNFFFREKQQFEEPDGCYCNFNQEYAIQNNDWVNYIKDPLNLLRLLLLVLCRFYPKVARLLLANECLFQTVAAFEAVDLGSVGHLYRLSLLTASLACMHSGFFLWDLFVIGVSLAIILLVADPITQVNGNTESYVAQAK
jgi:hypothetical protein